MQLDSSLPGLAGVCVENIAIYMSSVGSGVVARRWSVCFDCLCNIMTQRLRRPGAVTEGPSPF